MLWQDPIIEEIHRIREAHSQKFNYDVWAIYQDLKAKELKSEWQKMVSKPNSSQNELMNVDSGLAQSNTE